MTCRIGDAFRLHCMIAAAECDHEFELTLILTEDFEHWRRQIATTMQTDQPKSFLNPFGFTNQMFLYKVHQLLAAVLLDSIGNVKNLFVTHWNTKMLKNI